MHRLLLAVLFVLPLGAEAQKRHAVDRYSLPLPYNLYVRVFDFDDKLVEVYEYYEQGRRVGQGPAGHGSYLAQRQYARTRVGPVGIGFGPGSYNNYNNNWVQNRGNQFEQGRKRIGRKYRLVKKERDIVDSKEKAVLDKQVAEIQEFVSKRAHVFRRVMPMDEIRLRGHFYQGSSKSPSADFERFLEKSAFVDRNNILRIQVGRKNTDDRIVTTKELTDLLMNAWAVKALGMKVAQMDDGCFEQFRRFAEAFDRLNPREKAALKNLKIELHFDIDGGVFSADAEMKVSKSKKKITFEIEYLKGKEFVEAGDIQQKLLSLIR